MLLVMVILIDGLFNKVTGATELRQKNLCSLGEMDGFSFFSENLTYIMLNRTYDVPGGLNTSMCVMAPFPPVKDDDLHKMRKTFTYRNLSTTHKLEFEDPKKDIFLWPVAKFDMQFYNASASFDLQKSLDTDERFNYVNSTFAYKAFGYHLEPPDWIFWYCDQNCSVVKVMCGTSSEADPTHKENTERKPHCELWIRVPLGATSHDIELSKNWMSCTEFLKSKCNDEHIYPVYSSEMCS
nr:uncharacterized protein LOC129388308 isoform X1 [Dermacentor andersoni]